MEVHNMTTETTLFEGVEEPRRSWCERRMVSLREWVKSRGRTGSVDQLEAALARIAGLESLINERDGISHDR